MENKNKNIDSQILEKLTRVIDRLDNYRPSLNTSDDLDDLQEAIKEIRGEINTLKEDYHALDKQTVEFINRLDSLEKSIQAYEKTEEISEDKVRAVVGNFVSLLIGSIIAYIFSQLKQW